MTETELLQSLTDNGWVVLESNTFDPVGTLEHKSVKVSRAENGTMVLKTVYYFIDNGAAYWQDYSPITTTPVQSFNSKVRAKIKALVTAGTIKAAYIEKVDESSETALVVAVKTDNAFQAYHIWSDASDVIQIQALTGTYPIG